jgi:solute carrier family 25 folate transporter 32
MHPLDLLKTKLQTSTTPGKGNVFKHIWLSLGSIYAKDGVKGLYRGVGPNVAGNASSWGLYFWLWVFPRAFWSDRRSCESDSSLVFSVISYNVLKKRGSEGGEGGELTSGQTLLYAAEASQSCPVPSDPHEVANIVLSGAATAILTNPIWVVKIRMFTTHPNDPTAYRNTWRTYLLTKRYLRAFKLTNHSPYRWAVKYLQNRGIERSLPRHSLGLGWREQRRATVHGIRTDQDVGV